MSDTPDSPSQERSRTLVRVVEVHDLSCKVIVPGFDANEHITVLREQVPTDIWDLFEPDKRLHAKVNVGAYFREDLVFSDWEKK